jgi:hypothetical protein
VATTPQTQIDPSKTLRSEADRCKRKRNDLVDSWAISVDYLRGKPFEQESDEDRVYVNSDHVMARRKSSQLASQLPEARLKARNDRVRPILGAFATRLNETLRRANVGAALFEVSKDVINAAGIGVVLCGYEARTEMRLVPAVDPMTLTPDQQAGLDAAKQLDDAQAAELLGVYQIPTTQVPKVISSRFYARRISPSDFLWPLEFERSDFDEAPWLGHSDRMRWAEAKLVFDLKDEQKESVLGARSRAEDNLRDDADNENASGEELVEYDQIFYWRAKYDPDEKHLDCIWRIVFVKGIDEPVIHAQWEGQKYLESVGYVGALKSPLRVLTLDYVSDDAIPPSDSAVARPQVNEMIRSRTQMIQQRERSTPLRWHDVNRVDPLTSANMMRGVYQGSIPVKGNGNSIIGEVARASYPTENYQFEQIIKGDLTEAWGIDQNQLGMFARGRRTAKEADVVQANFATQIGFQRARVAAFFNGIAEVIAGLMVLHSDDLPTPPQPQPQQQAPGAPGAPGAPPQPQEPPIDVRQLSQLFDYSVLPDATVLLDANQRADQLMDVLDMVGKSGFVNPEPLIEEILMCKGIDPAKVMRKPEPQKEDPNISYRLSGVQDLVNPVVLAMLVEKGQAPSPESLKAAFKILQAAGIPITPELLLGIPPEEGPMGGGMPGLPPAPQRPALPPADARPEWTAMPTIQKRSE